MVNFEVSSHHQGKATVVEAVVIPKVTTDIPSTSVIFDTKWKHLIKLQFADSDFSTPGNVQPHITLWLEYGPMSSPSSFGWILAGVINTTLKEQQVTTYSALMLTGNDLLRKLGKVEDCNIQKQAMSLDK